MLDYSVLLGAAPVHTGSTFTPLLLAGAVTVLGGLSTTLVAALGARRVRRVQRGSSSEETLEDRLDELSKSMSQSARLVEQVTAELDARSAMAKRLKKEAEDAEALAKLHQEQADAIRRMMDAELAGSERRIRRDSVVIGITSFIFGGGVSFLVTLLVHPLH